jgi:hypothetical protein
MDTTGNSLIEIVPLPSRDGEFAQAAARQLMAMAICQALGIVRLRVTGRCYFLRLPAPGGSAGDAPTR